VTSSISTIRVVNIRPPLPHPASAGHAVLLRRATKCPSGPSTVGHERKNPSGVTKRRQPSGGPGSSASTPKPVPARESRNASTTLSFSSRKTLQVEYTSRPPAGTHLAAAESMSSWSLCSLAGSSGDSRHTASG